ncbi:TrmH family RNA methyltransferase [Jatrophihabitans sp. YIM 134969]
MPLIPVTDPADPRLADFRDLTDADVRPDRRGVVIAEGWSTVERLLDSPYQPRAVFGVPSRVEALAPVLEQVPDLPVYVADKWLLSEVVGFRVTRGVLASADRGLPLEPAAVLTTARRVVVLEGLNDFENLGAVFRNAAAFGLDSVLLDPTCADPLYRRSVRVSMGHVLRVPFAVADDPVATARAAGLTTVALTPRAEAVAIRSFTPPARWAVVLGAEGPGLPDASIDAADVAVRIPMAPGVDSLNVATAGAVAFAMLAL